MCYARMCAALETVSSCARRLFIGRILSSVSDCSITILKANISSAPFCASEQNQDMLLFGTKPYRVSLALPLGLRKLSNIQLAIEILILNRTSFYDLN